MANCRGGGTKAAKRVSAEIPKVGLKAIEEVSFKGLFTVRLILGEDGRRRVVPAEIAGRLGMDERAMRRRTRRSFQRGEAMMALPSSSGTQEYQTLDLRYLSGLLLGAEPSRVAEHLRPRLEEIQEDLHEALYNYTFHGAAVNEDYVKDATDEERDAIAAKLRTELVPVRKASEEILERVERLPASIDGIGAAISPYLHQIVGEANQPTALRVQELHNLIVAFVDGRGREMTAIRETVDKLIDAFGALAVAQQKGRAEVLAILAKLGEQNDRLAQAILTSHDLVIDTNKLARTIASRDGTIPGEEVDKIKDKVARLVELRAAKGGLLGDRKAMSAIRADVYADLFAYLNWGRKGQGLASMPAEKGPLAKAFLDFAIRKLVKGDRRKDSAQPPQAPQDEASRQPSLFGDKPGDGSDKPN